MLQANPQSAAATTLAPGLAAPTFQNPDALVVVGIGASAGGLDACTKLVTALPADTGLAYILVQHLDPQHPSMMVDLLATHTKMPVLQAVDGMILEPDHFYIIAPDSYLSVAAGILRVTPPIARHGMRLPFDFLLHALALDYGPRAIGVILSGTGTDGTLGLDDIKTHGGLVIAQDFDEAEYSGMPANAVRAGVVDRTMKVADMPAAFMRYRLGAGKDAGNDATDLRRIIALLSDQTGHDFSLYKPGTLQRRIERRMAILTPALTSMLDYLGLLRAEPHECALLSQDLLINVTSFFRDPKVFETLEHGIIPDLIRKPGAPGVLRIWIAGCSTGEETYSLAILCREQLIAAGSHTKLQIFASDVDVDAVTQARTGLYPGTIEADVSAARLARFFVKEDGNYRVSAELRASIVFTVQDVLSDPPFSRLDLVSCRNLLIYLLPQAQAQVLAVFHFALRDGGVLLLGSAETIGHDADRFEVISKPCRLYRRIGQNHPGDLASIRKSHTESKSDLPGDVKPEASRRKAYAELGRRLVLENFSPAVVLTNRKLECLFSVGPTDRYLQVAPGTPSHDLLAMARPGLRAKLQTAAQLAMQDNMLIRSDGGRIVRDGVTDIFSVTVQPVSSGTEDLLLVCFNDAAAKPPATTEGANQTSQNRLADVEAELDSTKRDLQAAMRDLAAQSEDQKSINEEALSVNEEHQSTNEELLTSKEELQSLNEELTALNAQLQETLERQRTTSDDLQNVLYSTDVATIFLDKDLKIRFFTPATKLVFNVIPGDIGRPLADLHSLAPDAVLQSDVAAVLHDDIPRECEIETPGGTWFMRRVLPYRTHGGKVEGVVLTFTDITERKKIATALEAAQRGSEDANAAKTRFLAAASHDLRQPLQTLALLQGLLARSVEGAKKKKLVALLDDTLSAMSGMLTTLLDINQIDAGILRAEIEPIHIGALLNRLREEFTYHAQAQGLTFHVVSCGLTLRSDPRLLEQILRNLISNAFKYTRHGKVLLGCRRHGAVLRIEVWDTGIGIPAGELDAIFNEYHQLDNPARERSRGLGLGLPIVQRLSKLLGHKVHVQSWLGRGSVFSLDVTIDQGVDDVILASDVIAAVLPPALHRSGTILLVEDDLAVSSLLDLFLQDEGYRVLIERDGVEALATLARTGIEPDLILTDYNLPNRLSGLQLALSIRKSLRRDIPVIILTGDISAETLNSVHTHDFGYMCKPVKLGALAESIQALLPVSQIQFRPPGSAAGPNARFSTETDTQPTVFVIDDNRHVRESICAVLREDGRLSEDFEDAEKFLAKYTSGCGGCLLVDANLPGMSGLELLQFLRKSGDRLPVIMITGNSDVHMAVEVMKAGAADFVEKPIGYKDLLESVDRALERSRDVTKVAAWREDAANHINGLTARQHQIMALVLAGHPSKNIAADLGISQRTVENHRAAIMKRTGSSSLPALARLAVTASLQGTAETSD